MLGVALLAILSLGCAPKFEQPELGARKAEILTEGKYQFKDLNKNGQLDPYEDWRLPMEKRIADLVSQMTLEEKVGLMFHPNIAVNDTGIVKYDLTDEEKEFLYVTADLMQEYPTVPCNQCNYCMPCPYGLDIPGILTHYNKCVNQGSLPESQQDPNYREARQAFLVGYDRTVPRMRQASHCTNCNQCSPHCPQMINIPDWMNRIDDFVEKLKQNTL